LIIIATAAVLAYFNQTRELYRAYAQAPFEYPYQITAATLSLLLATFISWYTIRDTIAKGAPADLMTRPLLARYLRWFPAIAALLPISAAVGLYLAYLEDPATVLDESQHALLGAALETYPAAFGGIIQSDWVLMGAAMFFALFGLIFIILIKPDKKVLSPASAIIGNKFIPIGLLLFVFISFLIISNPIVITRYLGAITIVLLFSICLILLVRYFYNFSPFLNAVPLAALALFVIFLSFEGWNNYTVAPLEVQKNDGYQRASEAFETWFAKRADRKAYSDKGKAYPVFLVAASGGGIYAARQTAMTLAYIQDRCPSFAQHIFAISGISGGSWGAALFNRLAYENAPNDEDIKCEPPAKDPGLFQTKVQALLNDDFLSPLVGVGLFPNLFQSIWPHSIREISRSATFESLIEKSWGNTAANPFTMTVFDNWDPNKSGGALLLNMTDADLGYQVVAAPFRVRHIARQEKSAFQNVEEFLNELIDKPLGPETSLRSDIKLSSAVALSAGFPIVIGGGNIETHVDGQGKRQRLVDGGYYENSGVDTLLQIIAQLKDKEVAQEIDIHVIVLDKDYEINAGDTFHGLLEPVRALISTRSVRARISISNLYNDRSSLFMARNRGATGSTATLSQKDEMRACEEELLEEGITIKGIKQESKKDFYGPIKPIHVTLDLRHYLIPLAFQLSNNSAIIVDAFSGAKLSCPPPKDSDKAFGGRELTQTWQRLQCNQYNLCRGIDYIRTLQ